MSAEHPVFEYIFQRTTPGVKLELDRIRGFIREIGEPWRNFRSIHIAGTNGKGSTTAFTASLLQAAGYRTGQFTSPHLISPTERIRVDGERIPEDILVQRVEEWKPLIEKHGLTFFEVFTALALDHFQREKVDWAVIETGLGGRLDATNVIRPELSLITRVDLDHTGILGETLEEIAFEKAGIIKPGIPVLAAVNQEPVLATLREVAQTQQGRFYLVGDLIQLLEQNLDLSGQNLVVRLPTGRETFRNPLLGPHQADNLLNALAALEILDIHPGRELLQRGIDAVYWPARMEVLRRDPPVLYDVAHNPAGLRTLLATLRKLRLEDLRIAAGLNHRKDLPGMLTQLRSWPGGFRCFPFHGHNSTGVGDLLEAGVEQGELAESFTEALHWADEKPGSGKSPGVCICGSHYFAAEVYEAFQIELC